ncbi:uncharacterized protein kiaa1958 isoform 1-T2 [Synchiropus picturatus]
MPNSVHTSSESLCQLVRWAHSHGTICNLIPSLQHHTRGSFDKALTTNRLRGNNHPVAVWGCSAGHAYHWPLDGQGNMHASAVNTGHSQEGMVRGHQSSKGPVRLSFDLSSEPASEAEEFNSRLFDIRCDSSATDEEDDLQIPRKRTAMPRVTACLEKRVKQEANPVEDYDAETNTVCSAEADANTHRFGEDVCSDIPLTKSRTHCHSQTQQADQWQEEQVESEVKQRVGANCPSGNTDQFVTCSSPTKVAERTSGERGEVDKLRTLLNAERCRNQQMTEMISSLKQDKALLQQELTKKAELICDFFQDKLHAEKKQPHCSSQMEPGSSHTTPFEDVAVFEQPALFDSYEEAEHLSLEHLRVLKSKRSRDGENTRVRMKNVSGVIARYMAALQEFRRSVSMKVAFDRVGVDRNTISRTAAIAELSLAAPDVFHSITPWNEKEETLAHYAHRCRQAMDDNILAKIKIMKAKGELLPIVSK